MFQGAFKILISSDSWTVIYLIPNLLTSNFFVSIAKRAETLLGRSCKTRTLSPRDPTLVMVVGLALSLSRQIWLLLAVSLLFVGNNSSRDTLNVNFNLQLNEIDDSSSTSTTFYHLCYWRRVRHFVFVARCNGYFSRRVSYTVTLTAP